MTREEREQAWAAGLFEGEGTICVGTHSSNGRKWVRIALGTTDKDVMDRFVAAIGCGRENGPYVDLPGRKPRWHWQCSREATEQALKILKPFLGKRRREQLVISQAVVDAQPPPTPFVGRPHTEESKRLMSDARKRWWAEQRAGVRR